MQYFFCMNEGVQQKTSCNRCGTCCKQGGPALHGQDQALIVDGFLGFSDLITVRKGELAMQPMVDEPQPVEKEFLKLQGRGRDWCCKFYDNEAAGCTIYMHRPVACGLLDCSHPDKLLALAGRDLLNRFDLLDSTDPLTPLIELHEEHCPCPDFAALPEQLAEDRQAALDRLSRLVQLDLGIRAKAGGDFGLSVEQELFYFGRPLFQLLQLVGFSVTETVQGLQLQYTPGRE